ncbi:uroporphyrinogen-III synthase [Alsobacter sp. SYSU BS001988]
MHVLLTRPEPDARRTAERLAAAGHQATLAPVISITPTGTPLADLDVDALVATSANARLAFPEGPPAALRELPVYVVGDRTADAMAALGFVDLRAGAGDAASLAALIRERQPAGGRLLYVAGTDRKPTLESALWRAGFDLVVHEAYRAEAVQDLPAAAGEALREGRVDAVLHFSRRSAEILFALAHHDRLDDALRGVDHLCLSADVARAPRAAGMPRVREADAPTEAGVLALLADRPPDGGGTGGALPASSPADGGGSAVEAVSMDDSAADEAGSAERRTMTGDRDTPRADGRRKGASRREPQVIDLTAQQAAETPSGAAGPLPPEPAASAPNPAESPPPEPTPVETAGTAEPAPEAIRAAGEGEPLDPTLADASAREEAEIVTPKPDETEAPPRPVGPSVPPVGPSRAEPPARSGAGGVGFVVPAAAGLVGGLAGAGFVALALMLWGGAGDINDRLTNLETGVGEKATRRTVEALEKRVAATEADAKAARSDLDAALKRLPPDPAAALAQVTERLDKVETGVGALEARPAPAAPPPPAPPPPAPALGARESAVMSVAWLTRDALNRGAPFARELDALKAAKVDPAALAPLEPFAQKGAPTVASLSAQFTPLAERIANPPEPPAQGGVLERMQARIGGLYKVRPLGEAQGDSPAAVAARADLSLKRGALADAVAELDRLPADVKPTVASFLDAAKARLAAGRAADALVTASVDQVLAATQSGGAAR